MRETGHGNTGMNKVISQDRLEGRWQEIENRTTMAFLNDSLATFHRVAQAHQPQSLRQCPERYPRLPECLITQKAPGLYRLRLTSLNALNKVLVIVLVMR